MVRINERISRLLLIIHRRVDVMTLKNYIILSSTQLFVLAENLFTADIGKATDGQQMLCAPSPSLDRRAGVVVECFPRMREIGVRSPVATDLIN